MGIEHYHQEAILPNGINEKVGRTCIRLHDNTSKCNVKCFASDMQLTIASDASYLNELNAKSNYGGCFFLGWNQHNDEPLCLNGCLPTTVRLLKLVLTSVTEGKLGGLFCNAQYKKVL